MFDLVSIAMILLLTMSALNYFANDSISSSINVAANLRCSVIKLFKTIAEVSSGTC